MASNYLDKAKETLELIYPYIKDARLLKDFDYAIRMANALYDLHLTVHSGCSRVAICGRTFVIKVDYDKDNVREIGGCLKEYNFYNKIKDTDVAKILCPIDRIKMPARYYYIMPRASQIGEHYSHEFTRVQRKCAEKYGLADLHRGNLGVYKKHLVIIDYAYRFKG